MLLYATGIEVTERHSFRLEVDAIVGLWAAKLGRRCLLRGQDASARLEESSVEVRALQSRLPQTAKEMMQGNGVESDRVEDMRSTKTCAGKKVERPEHAADNPIARGQMGLTFERSPIDC